MPFSALQCVDMPAKRPFCLFTSGDSVFLEHCQNSLDLPILIPPRKTGNFGLFLLFFLKENGKSQKHKNGISTKRNLNFVKQKNGDFTVSRLSNFASRLNFFSKLKEEKTVIWPKKKSKSVSCSRSQNCNAECVFFYFFFTIHEKAMRNAIFIFLNKTSGRKYIKTIALVSFLTFNKNITSFIWFMWPFILHALGPSLMNFLPWPKLHHILYIKF